MSPKGNTRKANSLLIELKNITRSFGYGEAESYALNDFNLEVKPGEFIMIMGPSGCGKTTLLNILGLLDFPTSGSYYLDSERTTHFSKSRQARIRAKKIGFIFQDFNLIPKMTILENVSLPLIYAGIPKTKCLVRSSKILSYLNMQQREYYYPYQLSGGQKQRVAIARALVSSPEIILADEPTGNLDSKNASLVMEELRRIHSEGNTIIMVTHNPNLTTYATRVIHMLDGRIDTDIKTVADEDLPDRVKVKFQTKKVANKKQPTNSSLHEESPAEPIIINRPIKQVGSKYIDLAASVVDNSNTNESLKTKLPSSEVLEVHKTEAVLFTKESDIKQVDKLPDQSEISDKTKIIDKVKAIDKSKILSEEIPSKETSLDDHLELKNHLDLKPIFVDTTRSYQSKTPVSKTSPTKVDHTEKPLSYKLPTNTEISVDNNIAKNSETKESLKSAEKTEDKKPAFPIVSSNSTDNSVRVVKRPITLADLEKTTVKKKVKAKTKLAKSIKKQVKGRRK